MQRTSNTLFLVIHLEVVGRWWRKDVRGHSQSVACRKLHPNNIRVKTLVSIQLKLLSFALTIFFSDSVDISMYIMYFLCLALRPWMYLYNYVYLHIYKFSSPCVERVQHSFILWLFVDMFVYLYLFIFTCLHVAILIDVRIYVFTIMYLQNDFLYIYLGLHILYIYLGLHIAMFVPLCVFLSITCS